jgi:acetyl esterase/lipase
MPIPIDQAMLDDARRMNARLARMPRFGMRLRLMPPLVQALLNLSQLGADGKLRRRGIAVERRTVEHDGVRVPLRILRPPGPGPGPATGVILDIHGGGWVIGNARMNDALNAGYAEACNATVVSVDYRLATRAPLAALMDDCLAAAHWLLGDGLPECTGLPIVLIGESAGGHLAAATLQRLQATPELLQRIAGALLYYGVYDLAGTPSVHAARPETLVLDGPRMASGLRMLTPGLDDAARRAPALSPLYGALVGMPPALMIAGQADPLLDDTLELARRWRDVANVELEVLPEAPHGFIHFPTSMARATCAHAQEWIRKRFAAAGSEASSGLTETSRKPALSASC